MSPKSTPPFPDSGKPGPGTPKHFPEQTLFTDDGVEAAKHESASTMKPGSGGDPFVESGLPDNDPERPRETPEEKSNR